MGSAETAHFSILGDYPYPVRKRETCPRANRCLLKSETRQTFSAHVLVAHSGRRNALLSIVLCCGASLFGRAFQQVSAGANPATWS
jgi:hypothetical protein